MASLVECCILKLVWIEGQNVCEKSSQRWPYRWSIKWTSLLSHIHPILCVAVPYFHASRTTSALSMIYDSLFSTSLANISKTSESEVLKHSVSVLHSEKLQGLNRIMHASEVRNIFVYEPPSDKHLCRFCDKDLCPAHTLLHKAYRQLRQNVSSISSEICLSGRT